MDLALAAGAASAEGGSGYWQLAMVLAAIGFLGLFARWRKAHAPAAPSARELRERDENPNRYRDAADRAIVELLETSQSLNAQVDTKIRVLNRLVKQADESCARLEKLLAATGGGGAESPTLPAAADAAAPPPPVPERERPAEPEPRFVSELHERIHRLRSGGKSVAEIAKATDLSTTEVEFVINLLQRGVP